MKKSIYFIFAIIFISTGLLIVSCKSSKPVSVTKTDEQEVSFPCSGQEFYSTANTIRSTAVGESMDQQMAKRIARSAALEDLSSKIGVTVNGLITDYYKSTNVNLTEDLRRRFEGGTDLIIKEYISGYRTVCEKFTRKGDNYKCYLAIEIGTGDILKPLHKKLSEETIMKVDYNYEQFKKRFEEAMQKTDQNR